MICLDSDCIIDFLKGKKEAVDLVRKYKEEIITTEINRFEVLFGIYLKKKIEGGENNSAKLFFDSLDVLPFNENCGEEAARILFSLAKEGNVINQNDCLISAIMIKNGCRSILTGNKKHFERIKGISVKSY